MYFIDTLIGFYTLLLSKEWFYFVSLYTFASIGVSVVFSHTFNYASGKALQCILQIPYFKRFLPGFVAHKFDYTLDNLYQIIKNMETEIESIQDEKVKDDVRSLLTTMTNYFQDTKVFIQSKYDSMNIENMRIKTNQLTDDIFSIMKKYR